MRAAPTQVIFILVLFPSCSSSSHLLPLSYAYLTHHTSVLGLGFSCSPPATAALVAHRHCTSLQQQLSSKSATRPLAPCSDWIPAGTTHAHITGCLAILFHSSSTQLQLPASCSLRSSSSGVRLQGCR